MQYSTLGIPTYHETLDVMDSTKLSKFQDCPRSFFYEYVLGWRPKNTSIHLGVGSAWHESMEYLINFQDGNQVGYTMDQAIEAVHIFNKKYDEIFQPEEVDGISLLAGYVDTTNGAKDKSNIARALVGYVAQYAKDNFTTIRTEESGTVLVGQDRMIYCKLDSIIEEKDGAIWSLEHKTTGRKSSAWLNDWKTKIQIGTYYHLLETLYPGQVAGIKINGAILRAPTKAKADNNEFIRIPITMSPEMQEVWRFEVNYWLDLMDWNMVALSKAKPSDPVMEAFPRNPASCSKFGCPYSALCTSWANPVKHMEEVPMGYRIEHWDPRTHTTEVTEP